MWNVFFSQTEILIKMRFYHKIFEFLDLIIYNLYKNFRFLEYFHVFKLKFKNK